MKGRSPKRPRQTQVRTLCTFKSQRTSPRLARHSQAHTHFIPCRHHHRAECPPQCSAHLHALRRPFTQFCHRPTRPCVTVLCRLSQGRNGLPVRPPPVSPFSSHKHCKTNKLVTPTLFDIPCFPPAVTPAVLCLSNAHAHRARAQRSFAPPNTHRGSIHVAPFSVLFRTHPSPAPTLIPGPSLHCPPPVSHRAPLQRMHETHDIIGCVYDAHVQIPFIGRRDPACFPPS